MCLLLLGCSLLAAAWGDNVYYSPLSTQCPDTTRPSPFLHHNDIFLYDHDVTGDFPDIKRSLHLPSGYGIYKRSTNSLPEKGVRGFRLEHALPDRLGRSKNVLEMKRIEAKFYDAQSSHKRPGWTREHLLPEQQRAGPLLASTNSRDPTFDTEVPQRKGLTDANNFMTSSKEASLVDSGDPSQHSSQQSVLLQNGHVGLFRHGGSISQHVPVGSQSQEHSPLFDIHIKDNVPDWSKKLVPHGLSGVRPSDIALDKNQARSLSGDAIVKPNNNWLKTTTVNYPPNVHSLMEQSLFGNKHKQTAPMKRVSKQYPYRFEDSKSPAHFSSQSADFMNQRQPNNSPKLPSIDTHDLFGSLFSIQTRTIYEVHGGLKADRYSREFVHRDVIQSTLVPHIQDSPHSQPTQQFQRRSERSSPVFPRKRSPSLDLLKRQQDSRKETASKRPRSLRTSDGQHESQHAALLKDLQNVNPTLWSILHDMASRQENWGWNDTESMINALLYCLGRDPSDLNKLSLARSDQRPSAARQGASQEQPLDHNPSHLDEKSGNVNVLSDRKRSDVLHPEFVETISNMIESARAYKHSMLENVIQQQPEIIKRLSFIHPSCLNGKLDFVKSTTNIDAGILQFLTELTNRVSNSSRVNETRSTTKRESHAREDVNYQLDTPANSFHNQENARPDKGVSTSKRTNHRSVDQPKQALRRPNAEHHHSIASGRHAGKTASRPKASSGWKHSSGSGSGSGSGARMKRRAAALSRRSEPPAQQRFLPGSPLPWSCPSITRWRDLGMHVFPRYVQETSCVGGNSSSSSSSSSNYNQHLPPTCWYGFYHCRPTTSAVQVLVRHTGSCNDSRVPHNMRRHYFLSIISINTGCNCV